MKKYLEQEAVIHAVIKSFWSKGYVSDVELAQAIRDVDAADVVERRCGPQEDCEWCGDLANRPCHACKIKYDHYNCGEGHPNFQMLDYNFCPECGSDLRGVFKK